jgi:heme A synthase
MPLPRISLWLAWLAAATAAALYVVIVAGGVVRVSGSGLGCPDWPQCYGQWMPPPELAAWIEFTHRVAASVGSLLLAATALAAWLAYRRVAWIVAPALAAVVLLVAQIGLGAVTVVLELPPTIVAAHLGAALLLLAMALAVAVAAFFSRLEPPPAAADDVRRRARLFSRQVFWLALATFGLLLTGAVVAGASATWACPGVPWCEPQLRQQNPLAWLQMAHRSAAVAVTALLAWLAVRGWGLRRSLPGVGAVAPLAAALALAQVGVGVGGVLLNFPPAAQGLHLAVAALVWAAVAALAVLARLGADRLTRAPAGADRAEPAARRSTYAPAPATPTGGSRATADGRG